MTLPIEIRTGQTFILTQECIFWPGTAEQLIVAEVECLLPCSLDTQSV